MLRLITSITALVFIVMVFVGCKKNDLPNSYHLKLKVLSEVTQAPIINAKVVISTYSYDYVNSIYTYKKLLNTSTYYSDNNGEIGCTILYNNDPNIVVQLHKVGDSISTGLCSLSDEYTLDSLRKIPVLNLYVRKYASLKITLKSINPINDSDAVSIQIFQNNAPCVSVNIDSIVNMGVKNQPIGYPYADNGNYPYWIGQNVNSIIYGKLQEGTNYIIYWYVRKNRVNSTYKSATFNTIVTGLNTYDITY